MIDEEMEKHNLKTKKTQPEGRVNAQNLDLLEAGTLDRKLINYLVRRLWANN